MNLFGNTDLVKLRQWLSVRVTSLKNERVAHEGYWRLLAEHYEPDLGRALYGEQQERESEAAAPRDGKLMSSVPRTELRRMAAALKSGTANESRPWFRFRLRGTPYDELENPMWKQWIDATTYNLQVLLNGSNAYAAIGRMLLHTILFGSGAGIVSGQHPHDLLEIKVLDTGSWWIGSTRSERIDVLLRRVVMSAREVQEEFGEKRMPESVERALDVGKDEQPVVLWNMICPNQVEEERFGLDGELKFASAWWCDSSTRCGGEDTNGIVDIRGYTYNPILCPRWDVLTGVYGMGPGRIGMPDVKMLYKLEREVLKAIALRVDPPMAVPDIMQGVEINTYPGGRTYYPMSAGRDRSLHPLLDSAPDVQSLQLKIQEVEQRIKRVFYADLFAAILNVANQYATQMTARQIDEMSGEKIALLGPVLTNLNHGLFDPLIDAAYAILKENGGVPEPPESLAGMEFVPEYISVLHMRQQEEARLGGITRFVQFAQGVLSVNPVSADKIDFDEMLDEAGVALAVPGKILRSDKDVESLRAQRAQAAAEQQRMQQMMEMGRQAKDYAEAAQTASETEVGDANLLESMLGAARQSNAGMLDVAPEGGGVM